MGDVLKTLFGGGKSESQSGPVDMTPDAFKALRGPLADSLMKLLQQGGTPSYGGPLTSPIGGNEQATLDMLQKNTMNPNDRGAGDLLSSTINGNFLPGGPNGNPFLSAAIQAAQRPTLQGLTDTLSQALPGRFVANGQMIQPNSTNNGGSSAFDRAAAIATRGAADAIGNIATNMSYQGYNDERQRQAQAVDQSGSLTTQQVDNTIKNLQAQALPRLIQENGIDRGIQLFQQQTQSLLQLLQTLGAISAPALGQQSSSQSEVSKGIFSPIAIGGK
jgi:hypothetical protein